MVGIRKRWKKLILSSTLFKMISRPNAMPIRIPDAFLVDIDIDIQNGRGPQIAKQSWKKEKECSTYTSQFQNLPQINCNQDYGPGRHIDQWNKMESPDINSYIYGWLIFCQGAKSIQWGKNSLFNKWLWDNLIATCKRMTLDPYLTPYVNIISKWIKDLRAKPIKRVNLYGFGKGS